MKHLGFAGITVQLTILVVAVLTVSQALNLAHRYFMQSEALTALEAIRIADRIATLAKLIERAPPNARPELVEHFRGSNLPLAWTPEPWVKRDAVLDDKSRLLRDLLITAIPGRAASDVRVGYASSNMEARGPARLAANWSHIKSYPAPLGHVVDEFVADPTFLVSIPLSDGSWLNMIAAYADTLDFWPFDEIALLGSMVILVAILSIWAIRRLTAPLRLFAGAAARLGTDVNAPPLGEHGPAEVRDAIRAFNEMQRRLQRFISDRTQMLAAMSHDLRTPITRLTMRAEFVENPVQRAKALADLNEMEQMIAGVLSFAKDETRVEPSERVDLTAMLQSICDEMADRGRCVSFEGEGRVTRLCRSVSLRRCFTNLIDNAVKYGRSATVRVELGASDVLVHIDDAGPGIPDALREQVFRPFFRLEESRNRDSGGTGLGLSVARTVARGHGGDVILSNRPAGGLRATVRLPLSEQQSPQPPTPDADDIASATGASLSMQH